MRKPLQVAWRTVRCEKSAIGVLVLSLASTFCSDVRFNVMPQKIQCHVSNVLPPFESSLF
jgi:hypothetical protein